MARARRQRLEHVVRTLGLRRGPLFEQAFRHSSYVREAGQPGLESNERLEFLGDAVLDLVIATHLYRTHPRAAEGELTKIKAAVVSETSLAERASALGLGDELMLGRGEEEIGCRSRPSILAAALEALIGAVYLRQGLRKTHQFVLAVLGPSLEALQHQALRGDYKSALQELTQELTKETPDYAVRAEQGPPHDRTFTVEARFRGRVIGVGTGRSKRQAEQDAARAALTDMNAWAPRE
jgi:ribonuclease-3